MLQVTNNSNEGSSPSQRATSKNDRTEHAMPTPTAKVVPGLPQLTATDYCSGMGGRGALLSPGCGGSRGGAGGGM
jgi:hypothetical protein